MSASFGPARSGRPPHGGDADAGLRVSDAERAEASDRLAKHYADGRLDEAEFHERLDAAMKAKTRADLAGLFADLPGGEPPGGEPPGAEPADEVPANASGAVGWPRRRRPRHLILIAVLAIVISAAAGHALMFQGFPFPWLLIGLLVFLWARGAFRHGRR